MGGCMCIPKTSSSAPNITTKVIYTADQPSSYEEACKSDADLESFDTNLRTRTNQVINTIAEGVDAHALTFDFLKGVIEFQLETSQEVVKVILECKKDIWKNEELFELVEEYFENSLQTLDFYTALVKCLVRAHDSQLLIHNALLQFEEETEMGGNRYSRTLEVLKNYKATGDPFTEELFQILQSVQEQQKLLLDRLLVRTNTLDKKLKRIHAWRKVSSMIMVATFAALFISSVVTAAMAAPPVAAPLAVASTIPAGSVGKWIDSLWKNYEDALKGQKEVAEKMRVGTYVAIQDLATIRVLIDRVKIDIESLLHKANNAIKEEAVKLAVEEIKKNLLVFMKNCENLGAQADACSSYVQKARTEVLQRIIKQSNN